LDGNPSSHAAILLFSEEPQQFLHSAEIKCLHFHGIEIKKPIPSYQIYTGTIFDQVDKSVDFVMSKIARSGIWGRATVTDSNNSKRSLK
jgi:ATP-dependent DNA helicase RecG